MKAIYGLAIMGVMIASTAEAKGHYTAMQIIPQHQARVVPIVLYHGTHIIAAPRSHNGAITCLLAKSSDGTMVGGQVNVSVCDFKVEVKEEGVYILAIENEREAADTILISAIGG